MALGFGGIRKAIAEKKAKKAAIEGANRPTYATNSDAHVVHRKPGTAPAPYQPKVNHTPGPAADRDPSDYSHAVTRKGPGGNSNDRGDR